jgi:hypothetical protein
MQLRGTLVEREYKEKLLNRKIKMKKRKRKLGTRDCIEVSSAAWLNIMFSIML